MSKIHAVIVDPNVPGRLALSEVTAPKPAPDEALVRVAAISLKIHLPDLQWRQKDPKLAHWYDEFSKRPSIQATRPES
ncbi:hypothetical protein [Nostoc sp.]|uniref:hypothetical protein n=1 Tax=Nostoc sp. TaxID=1180 RepID=UPI002FF891B0